MKYRPEVDGLRALAVLPVILFHAGFETFSGGFVGVDVFFVISGYLITSILLHEIQNGSFSVVSFYERRARRILPALFLVMGTCVPFALLLFLPRDVASFSASLVAVSTFLSNVYFWLESGYFGTVAELQPLLHSWSLAVEEQYYVLFPIFLLFAWRFGRRCVSGMIFAICLVSLTAAHWAAFNKPAAAFFLLPTRLWELTVGALMALYLSRPDRPEPDRMIRQTGSAIGALLILYSIVAFDRSTPFPSLYALAPTVGTALVIVFASPETLVGRILGRPLLVGVGLISYSAYLWHQPLFAFARHTSIEEPEHLTMIALALAAMGLAYCSWRFVEVPCRDKSVFSRRTVFAASAAFTAVFIAIGVAGYRTMGFEKAYLAGLDARQQTIVAGLNARMNDNGECHFHAAKLSEAAVARFDRCSSTRGKAMIVLGDSHAMDVYQALTAGVRHPFVFGLSDGGCRPHSPSADCSYDAFVEFAIKRAQQIETILFNQAGHYLVKTGSGMPALRENFGRNSMPIYAINDEFVNRVFRYLDQLSPIRVVWLGPWIEPHKNASKLLQFALECSEHNLRVGANVTETFVQVDRRLAEQAGRYPHLSYVSSIDALQFDWAQDLYDCNAVYWEDGDHWSAFGERRFGRRLTAALALQPVDAPFE